MGVDVSRLKAGSISGNFLSALCLLTILACAGCQTAYYSAMEKVGIHKRDILVDRVEDARDAQQEVKKEFASALEQFRSVVHFEGGALEEKYNKLQKAYDLSEARAEEVRDRIKSIENVAEALFDEWESELDQYTSQDLRRSSEQKLAQTKKHYQKLIKAMKRAESKMTPVLNVFKDHVLFLKHNLNAKAIASLQPEVVGVERDVATLIKEMDKSIAEADAFIKTIETEQ